MTADPYRFTISWTNIFPTDSTLCCMMLGTAMAAICPSKTALNSTVLRSVLRAPRRLARVPRARRTERARELLNRVGLGERLDHLPNEMSGGQRQRVAIARALANEPPLILADEPTGNLDTASSIEIMELFSQLHKEGTTVVLVTHEEDIAAFADRIIRFGDGKLLSDERKEAAYAF